jgi:hypothetical protein
MSLLWKISEAVIRKGNRASFGGGMIPERGPLLMESGGRELCKRGEEERSMRR